MGRLANRLENRRHPLFPRAKDLRSCAVECWRDDDESELCALVEENMASLTPPELDKLVSLTLDECELQPEGEDISELVLRAVADVSETIEDPDGFVHTTLFALPLLLKANQVAWCLPHLDDEQCEQLQDLLLSYELLAEDAEVTFLPRLLSPQEADALGPGDVYALSRALADAETDTALEHLRVFRQRLGLSPEPEPLAGNAEGGSYGVLMGVVSSDEDVPFVMSRLVEVEHDALHENPSDDDPADAHAELVSDMRAELDKLNERLANILAVQDARVTEPADHWNALSGAALRLERSQRTRDDLLTMAREQCGGDVSALTVGRPDIEPELMTYPVLRRADGAPLGVIRWREGRHEDWHESMHRFMMLLSGMQVTPAFEHEDLPGADSPLH